MKNSKKILSLLLIVFVAGIIYAGYFSSIVKAQELNEGNDSSAQTTPARVGTTPVENCYEGGLFRHTGPCVSDTLEVQIAPGVTGKIQGSTQADTDKIAAQNGRIGLPWPFDILLRLIQNLLGDFLQFFIKIFSGFIQFALNLNNQLFNPDNVYIQNGWATARDIANLGFVLAIIIISFATIFRIEAYGLKKALTRLIIAALLVNFSLMICAAFVDLSGTVTNVFLNNLKGGAAGLGDNITNALGFGGITSLSFGSCGAGSAIAGILFGPIFIVIFLLIIALTLSALFVMLIIRYVWLGLLIILAPLAWLCFVLPATEKLWKQWWNHFFRWIIFAPAMSFFLWLALFSSNASDSAVTVKIQNFKAALDSASVCGASTIGNLFIMTGLLLGGLMVANSLGITGAKQFNKWALAGAAGIGTFVGSRMAGRALQATQRMAGGMKTLGVGQNRFLRTVTTPLRRAGFGMSQAQSRVSGGLVEAQEKRIEKMSKEDQVIMAKTGNAEQRMAAFNLLAKNNNLSELGSNDIATIQKTAGRFGKTKDVTKEIDKQVPHLSVDVTEATDKIQALTDKLAKLKEEDLGKINFGHMLKNEETSKFTVPAILANSKGDLRTLSSALKSLNTSQRDDLKTKIVSATTSQPNAHKEFISLAGKSKDLRIKQMAEDHNIKFNITPEEEIKGKSKIVSASAYTNIKQFKK